MRKWIIYSKDGNRRCVVHSLRYDGEWMGDCSVTVDLESPEPIHFAPGDYLEYRGERFTLSYTPTCSKTAPRGVTGKGFTYSQMRFSSVQSELQNCAFLDVVQGDEQGEHYTGLPTFSFYCGSVVDLAKRIKANLDRLYYTERDGVKSGLWTVAVAPSYTEEEAVNISADRISCLDALGFVKSEFDTYFTIKGRVITIGAAENVDSVMTYGRGNGFKGIEVSRDSGESVVTRLRAYGGEKNLPPRYYQNLNTAVFLPITGIFRHIDNDNNFDELRLLFKSKPAGFKILRNYTVLADNTQGLHYYERQFPFTLFYIGGTPEEAPEAPTKGLTESDEWTRSKEQMQTKAGFGTDKLWEFIWASQKIDTKPDGNVTWGKPFRIYFDRSHSEAMSESPNGYWGTGLKPLNSSTGLYTFNTNAGRHPRETGNVADIAFAEPYYASDSGGAASQYGSYRGSWPTTPFVGNYKWLRPDQNNWQYMKEQRDAQPDSARWREWKNGDYYLDTNDPKDKHFRVLFGSEENERWAWIRMAYKAIDGYPADIIAEKSSVYTALQQWGSLPDGQKGYDPWGMKAFASDDNTWIDFLGTYVPYEAHRLLAYGSAPIRMWAVDGQDTSGHPERSLLPFEYNGRRYPEFRFYEPAYDGTDGWYGGEIRIPVTDKTSDFVKLLQDNLTTSGDKSRIYVTRNFVAYNFDADQKETVGYLPDNMVQRRLMLPNFPKYDKTAEFKEYEVETRADGSMVVQTVKNDDTWLDSPYASTDGIKEQCVYFDGSDEELEEIYPSIEGMKASDLNKSQGYDIKIPADAVGDPDALDEIYKGAAPNDNGEAMATKDIPEEGLGFDIYLKDLGFNLNDFIIAGEDCKISMKSGMCAARDFEIKSVSEARSDDGILIYKIHTERVKDDSLGLFFPYKDYPIKAGDKFVITGFELPDAYIDAASQRLLTAALEYLDDHDRVKDIFKPTVDDIKLARKYDADGENSLYWKLKEGMRLKFRDDDLGVNETEKGVVIKTLSITEKGEGFVQQTEITLSDEKDEGGTIKRLENLAVDAHGKSLTKFSISGLVRKSKANAENCAAISPDKDIDGLNGYILRSMLKMGKKSIGGTLEKVTAGINGSGNTDSDIAFWGGGTYEAALKLAGLYYSGNLTESDWKELAGFCVTHGGDAFFRGYVMALGGIFRNVTVYGTVYANKGQFNGLVCGAMYKSICNITKDTFGEFFTAPDEESRAANRYRPNFGTIPQIIHFVSLPDNIMATGTGGIQLPPYTLKGEDFNFALSLIGNIWIWHNAMATAITFHSDSGSFDSGSGVNGKIFTLSPGAWAQMECSMDSSGGIVWMTKSSTYSYTPPPIIPSPGDLGSNVLFPINSADLKLKDEIQ